MLTPSKKPNSKIPINAYQAYAKKETLAEINSLASSLHGKKWMNIIFEEDKELFEDIAQLCCSLGVECNYTTVNRQQYMRHLLQHDVKSHLAFIEDHYQKVLVTADVISLHSPYLLFLLHNNNLFGNVLWHSYTPITEDWYYSLKPYIDQCAATVTAVEDFYNDRFKTPLYQIFHCAAPYLSKAKRQKDLLDTIACEQYPIFVVCNSATETSYHTQTIEAFSQLEMPCHLVVISPTQDIHSQLEKQTSKDKNITVICSPKKHQLQRILEESTALIYLAHDVPQADSVIASAMWNKTPVISVNTPALTCKIMHNKNGYLIDEFNVSNLHKAMTYILKNPKQTKYMGDLGHKHAQNYFLLPEYLRRYLQLISFYTHMTAELPSTRQNEFSYNEIVHNIRPQHPYLPKTTDMDLSETLPQKATQKYADLVGSSQKMQELFYMIERVADSDSSVLVIGETGTGKELVASALHSKSKRSKYELVSVNCAAIPETLQEATLFGYEKGAFTGAQKSKEGLIEKANNGTLFLDELGCASMELQAKLLRVLETKKFSRVGSTKEIAVDFRIVCATNVNPQQQVKEGNFREDLWYRVNSIILELPALRERGNDVTALAQHFSNLFTSRNDKDSAKWDEQALTALNNYSWPGNVRELKHTVEFALIMDNDHLITCEDLPKHIIAQSKSTKRTYTGKLQEARSSSERDYFIQLLQETNGNVSQTAKKAGLTRPYLYDKLKKLNIDAKNYRTNK